MAEITEDEDRKETYTLLAQVVITNLKDAGPCPLSRVTRDHALCILAKTAQFLDDQTANVLGFFTTLFWMLAKDPKIVEVDVEQILMLISRKNHGEEIIYQ